MDIYLRDVQCNCGDGTHGISSLVAFQNATPIVDILEAAYWKSVNPFIHFYLRDVQCIREDRTHGISSLVAVQAVVTIDSPESR